MRFGLMISIIEKKLFESAANIFGHQNNKKQSKSSEQKKIEKLEATLRDRAEAINYLLQETIYTKKIIGED